MTHRRTLGFAVAAAIIVSLAACQKTPDKDIVVDRSEGLTEQAIAPVLKEGEWQSIDAPLHWTEEINKNEGKVILNADIDILVPEVANLPVVEYKQKEFSDAMLKDLVHYFQGDEELYQLPAPTKQEVQVQLTAMQEQKGAWGSPDASYTVNSWIRSTEKRKENAADELQEAKRSDIAFTTPNAWKKDQYSHEGSQDETFIYEAMTGKERDAEISAMKVNEAVGSYNYFGYRKGSVFSEEHLKQRRLDLERWTQDNEGDAEWRNSYGAHLNTMEASMGTSQITQEEAKEKADALLKELKIKGIGVGTTSKCVLVSEFPNDNWDEMTVDWGQSSPGYSIQYYKSCGSLKGYAPPEREFVIGGLPETIYAPAFKTEEITIVITEEGIAGFEWKNMTEEAGVVAENTKLIPFDEVKEKLGSHLLYESVAADEENGFSENHSRLRYVVNNVELMCTFINAYEQPKHAWLVPTWVFTLDWKIVREDGSESTMIQRKVMINALDGGYIANGQVR